MSEQSPLLEEEVLSISSGESRAVRQSYVSELGTTSPSNQAHTVNSDDDFKLHSPNSTMATTKGGSPSSPPPLQFSPPGNTWNPTPPQVPHTSCGGGGGGGPDFSQTPTSHSFPPTSPTIVINGCPCNLQSGRKQECCVETVRAMHRARLEKVNAQTKLLRERKSSNSSYGSMDSATSDRQMISPVCSVNCGPSEGGGAEVQVVGRAPSVEAVHCGCHEPIVDSTTKKAVVKLVLASLIALVFMTGELLGEVVPL